METELMERLRRQYRIARVIGIAMVLSLFLYGAVVEILTMKEGPFRPFHRFDPFFEGEMLRYIFFGVAIIGFFLIRRIQRFILFKKVDMEQTVDPGRMFSLKIQRLMVATLITYGLCEWVALFGLILFFITGNSLEFYFFAVLSLIFYAIYFPRYRQWEDYISQGIGIGRTV